MSDRTVAPDRSGGAGPNDSSRPARSRWLCAECEAPDVDPFTFLADAHGTSAGETPRAYWRVGNRWAASRGGLAQIDSRELKARNLCTAVRAKAAELLRAPNRSGVPARPSPSDGTPSGSPRMYGGLGFHSRWSGMDPGAGESPWAEFPPARFVLPEFELSGGEGRVRLRAWRRLSDSSDPDTELGLAMEDLDRLRTRLTGLPRQESRERQDRKRRERELGSSDSLVREIVTRAEWRESIERVLDRIRAGDVQKVVLSRAVDVRLSRRPDPVRVVEELSGGDPEANVFLLQFGPDAAFFGASPELLGSLRGRDFRTMAVAGSARRGSDPEADDRLGRALLESPKDLAEHAICVRELESRLRRVTTRLGVHETARLHRLADIQHLRTDLTGKVAEGTHILDLVSILHPTAAVCGRPRDTAARVLAAEEPLSRGWYAGAVGWFNGAGDGDFAPGLRCAVLSGQVLRLFAGAGIVEGSRAEAEWEETSLKLRTIGRALGLEAIA